MTLDPRVTPARPDLAAAHLRGVVEAARFVAGTPRRVIAGLASLRAGPRGDAGLLTEALHGERVTVYEEMEGWAWVQLEDDGYVGWLPEVALGPAGEPPTHRVAALRTFLFPGPDIKLPPLDALPMNATLHAEAETGGFVRASGGYVCKVHLSDAGAAGDARAMAETARRFLGVPYLWGGRSALGIDCSGLVQMALRACGIRVLRDSDMQIASVGAPVADWTPETLLRNDLVFWKGHVAIALDEGVLLHANAHHMAVAIEPAAEAIARIRAAGQDVLAVRRMGPL